MSSSKDASNLFLKEYLGILALERNLSDNTILSYKNDINALIRFVEDRHIDDPSKN